MPLPPLVQATAESSAREDGENIPRRRWVTPICREVSVTGVTLTQAQSNDDGLGGLDS